MDQKIHALTKDVMTLLRQLYTADPGAFETEMAGDDDYNSRRIEDAIAQLLELHDTTQWDS